MIGYLCLSPENLPGMSKFLWLAVAKVAGKMNFVFAVLKVKLHHKLVKDKQRKLINKRTASFTLSFTL